MSLLTQSPTNISLSKVTFRREQHLKSKTMSPFNLQQEDENTISPSANQNIQQKSNYIQSPFSTQKHHNSFEHGTNGTHLNHPSFKNAIRPNSHNNRQRSISPQQKNSLENNDFYGSPKQKTFLNFDDAPPINNLYDLNNLDNNANQVDDEDMLDVGFAGNQQMNFDTFESQKQKFKGNTSGPASQSPMLPNFPQQFNSSTHSSPFITTVQQNQPQSPVYGGLPLNSAVSPNSTYNQQQFNAGAGYGSNFTTSSQQHFNNTNQSVWLNPSNYKCLPNPLKELFIQQTGGDSSSHKFPFSIIVFGFNFKYFENISEIFKKYGKILTQKIFYFESSTEKITEISGSENLFNYNDVNFNMSNNGMMFLEFDNKLSFEKSFGQSGSVVWISNTMFVLGTIIYEVNFLKKCPIIGVIPASADFSYSSASISQGSKPLLQKVQRGFSFSFSNKAETGQISEKQKPPESDAVNNRMNTINNNNVINKNNLKQNTSIKSTLVTKQNNGNSNESGLKKKTGYIEYLSEALFGW
ncbi:hypothetical protein HDU92_003934 [Lobulomyces angularis]|nr:hypothetical protein HDU92_003934 [Lobulomyces angularis]